MRFIANIDIMPHRELLDPQGKTVANNLPKLGIQGVADVRVGKHVRLDIDAVDEATARALAETACQKILTNPIMEGYTIAVEASH